MIKTLVLNHNNITVYNGLDMSANKDDITDGNTWMIKGDFKTGKYLYFKGTTEILDWIQTHNYKLVYDLVGGTHIPVNVDTYKRQHYFKHIGWWNMTTIEAIIFGELVEHPEHNIWVPREALASLLKAFGRTAASLDTHLCNLRKKIEHNGWKLENIKWNGYRVISPMQNDIIAYFMKINTESLKHSLEHIDAQTLKELLKDFCSEATLKLIENNIKDYQILYNDKKLSYITSQHFFPTISGEEYLYGWNRLTRPESQIFFELVRFRGDWVTYEHLLGLSWATEKKEGKFPKERKLMDAVGNIRQKTADVQEVILTKRHIGYCLCE